MFFLRKLYILPEENEGTDEALLDALAAAGISARHEGDLENPVCAVCGGATLLAYTEQGDFDVLTWSCLDDGDGAAADAWFLVCHHPECHWEEQVERVLAPMGADIFFDMEYAHSALDEEIGLISGPPLHLQYLAEQFKALQARQPNRKLECYLFEAEWRYEDRINDVRGWLERIPDGRRIRFNCQGEHIAGKFLMATPEGMLLLKQPGDELMVVPVQAVESYGPYSFDEPEPAEPEPADDGAEFTLPPADQWIVVCGMQEMIVVRGFPLRLSMTDRLGQYHAGTTDPAAAQALGLEPRGTTWFEGRFRRSEIEARYDEQRMVKVCGHWVEVYGESSGAHFPAVKTSDPAVAADLGLKPRALQAPAEPCYSGLIPRELVEAERFDRIYHWPAARKE